MNRDESNATATGLNSRPNRQNAELAARSEAAGAETSVSLSHPRVDKQSQLRAAARPILVASRSSSSTTSSSISSSTVMAAEGGEEESHRRRPPIFHRPIQPNTVPATASKSAHVRATPVAQGEWKPAPVCVPPVAYPGILSSPPTPRSLHAAAIIELPLGISTWARHSPVTPGDENERTATYETLSSSLAPKVDTLLLVHGGYNGQSRMNDMYEYDFNRKFWSLVSPNRPPQQQQHQQQQHPVGGDLPIVIMGADATDTTPLPRPRDRHAAVAHGTNFYIFGGTKKTHTYII